MAFAQRGNGDARRSAGARARPGNPGLSPQPHPLCRTASRWRSNMPPSPRIRSSRSKRSASRSTRRLATPARCGSCNGLRAVLFTPEQSELLGIEPALRGLEIERRGFTAGRPHRRVHQILLSRRRLRFRRRAQRRPEVAARGGLDNSTTGELAERSRCSAKRGRVPSVVARQRQRNRHVIADLARRLRERKPRAVVTLARGSSDHAATFGAI